MEFTSADQLVEKNVGGYQVKRLLERGQMSAVYFALHPEHRRPVALTTFLLPEKLSSAARQRFLQRFQTEATRLTHLRHRHIFPIYECGEHERYPYLITPYLTNGSLVDVMKHQKQFHYGEILALSQEVITGLAYAHQNGIVHGTLKPSNIILGEQGQTLVAGFGLKDLLQMRGIESDNRSYAHLLSVGGTFLTPPEYVAPEVVQGTVGDPRSDIYSLGIILFELLSGKLPFTGKNPLEVAWLHVQQQVPPLRSFCPDIPLVLAAIVNQALDRNPERRFQNVNELAEAFAQISAVFSEDESPENLMTHTRNEDLPKTPANGYARRSWQIQPPIVTGKLATVKPILQESSSMTLETSAPSKTNRSPAQPRIFPGANEKKQEYANAAPSLPDQHVAHPPRSAPPTLVPLVQELAASISLSSKSQDGSVAESSDATSFDWWMAPHEEPPPSYPATRTQHTADPIRERSTSNRHSRSSQRRRTRENPRVNRRRAIALLAVGGIAAVAGATTVLGIRYIIGR